MRHRLAHPAQTFAQQANPTMKKPMETTQKDLLPNAQPNESRMDLSQVFSERVGYINEMNLFVAHFNRVPHLVIEKKVDTAKAHRWFASEYALSIWQQYYLKRPFEGANKAALFHVFFLLKEDLLVFFDMNRSSVRFLFHHTDEVFVDGLVSKIRTFRKRRTAQTPYIDLLVNTPHGICSKPLALTRPKINIEDNYNDDFKAVHDVIIKRLMKKNDKGLVLLHGKPGTGKTSYIRHIIGRVTKNVIFLPPNLASAITNPELISVLVDNPNSVLVIEDAENIVVDRERDGNSPVSALLNISDGLLSDCLNIQIICSFNTDISRIDQALMRKGRLIAKYEFKELETRKAQALSRKLGFDALIQSPMTLTDIYNQKEQRFAPVIKTRPIGFMPRSLEAQIDEAC
jgi:hypothetical protein